MLNGERELFGSVEFVVDWFATYRWVFAALPPVPPTNAYTGLDAGEMFAIAPPVIVFNEQDDVPTVNGRIWLLPASVIYIALPPVIIEVARVAPVVISEFVVCVNCPLPP